MSHANRKPNYPVVLNRGHPLAKGLVSYGIDYYDLADNYLANYHTSTIVGARESDYIQLNDDGRNGEVITLRDEEDFIAGLSECTLLINCRWIGTNSAAEDSLIGAWSGRTASSNASTRALIRYDSNNNQLDAFFQTTATDSCINSVSIEDGEFHTLGGMCRSGTVYGLLDGLTLATTGTMTGSTISTTVGAGGNLAYEVGGAHEANPAAATTDPARIDLMWWGIWSRGLNDFELMQMHLSPYQVLMPAWKRGRIPVAAAAGGRIMGAIAGQGGLAGHGGLAGPGGGLAG